MLHVSQCGSRKVARDLSDRLVKSSLVGLCERMRDSLPKLAAVTCCRVVVLR